MKWKIERIIQKLANQTVLWKTEQVQDTFSKSNQKRVKS